MACHKFDVLSYTAITMLVVPVIVLSLSADVGELCELVRKVEMFLSVCVTRKKCMLISYNDVSGCILL